MGGEALPDKHREYARGRDQRNQDQNKRLPPGEPVCGGKGKDHDPEAVEKSFGVLRDLLPRPGGTDDEAPGVDEQLLEHATNSTPRLRLMQALVRSGRAPLFS